MSYGDVIGGLLKQGMKSGSSRQRYNNALGQSGGGGLEQLFGQLAGGQRSGSGLSSALKGPGSSGGALGGALQGLFGGGMAGHAKAGGLGMLAGTLLGGRKKKSWKGALGGGAIALLGSIALQSLQKQHQQQGQNQGAPHDATSTSSADMSGAATGGAGAGGGAAAAGYEPSEDEIEEMATPETAELVLKAMIGAAKADGSISQDEMERITGRLQEDGITDEERRFVLDEMSRPSSIDSIASRVPNKAVAAEIYAGALLTIDVDTEAEKRYLEELANKLGLDQGTVQSLHALTEQAATG